MTDPKSTFVNGFASHILGEPARVVVVDIADAPAWADPDFPDLVHPAQAMVEVTVATAGDSLSDSGPKATTLRLIESICLSMKEET